MRLFQAMCVVLGASALGILHADILTRPYYSALYGFSHACGAAYGCLLGVVVWCVARPFVMHLGYLVVLAVCLTGSRMLSGIRDMWIPSLLGIINAALAVAVWYACIHTHRRWSGELRCATCGYDLRGISQDHCTECGTNRQRHSPCRVDACTCAAILAVAAQNGALYLAMRLVR